MSYVQTGRGRHVEHRGVSGAVIAAIVAVIVVAAIAWYALSASYSGGGVPSAPYQTVAPASGAPATAAPTSNYP